MDEPDAWDEFDAWVKVGVTRGWVSMIVCATHDGIPSTPEEEDEWEQGHDPCQSAMRVWGPDGAP